MKRPHQQPRTTFTPIADGKWSATLQTAVGLVSAVGETQIEAQFELDRLLVIARALQVTRDHQGHLH